MWLIEHPVVTSQVIKIFSCFYANNFLISLGGMYDLWQFTSKLFSYQSMKLAACSISLHTLFMAQCTLSHSLPVGRWSQLDLVSSCGCWSELVIIKLFIIAALHFVPSLLVLLPVSLAGSTDLHLLCSAGGIEQYSGCYFSDCKVKTIKNEQNTDDTIADRLWRVSSQLEDRNWECSSACCHKN